MQLSKSQKKYIKKNIRTISASEIASNLKISENDLDNHLKEYWGEEKYQKYTQKTAVGVSSAISDSGCQADSKKFFKQNLKYFILIFILLCVTFFNSLGNEFLSDDIASIRDDPNVDKISNIFLPDSPYFSVIKTCHFIVVSIFGKNPAFFRLINIFAHLGSTILVFSIVSFFFSFPINLFAAGIFSVHTLISEAVIWISGIPYSVGVFFALLSFYLYLIHKKSGKNNYLIYSLIAYLSGLFTNAKLVSFPFFLLLYEILFNINFKNFSTKNVLTIVKRISFFFIFVLIFGLMLISAAQRRSRDLKNIHYQTTSSENLALKLPVAISSYLSLAFWPGKDISFYHSELNFSKTKFAFMVIGLIAYFALTLFFIFKNKKIGFWLSLFFISLIPDLLPFGLGWVVAERYVYFGSIGIFIFSSWGIYSLCKLIKIPKLSYAIVGIVVISLSIRTIVRNLDWRNQDYLWLATAKTSPSSPQNHNNLGDLYARRKEYDKSIEEFNIAISLKPNYGDAYHNVANVYVLTNQIEKAMEHYQKAIQFNPNLWQSHQNMGSVYYSTGKLDLAEQEFKKAIQINPNESQLRTALGLILLNLGKKEESISELKIALELNPQNENAKQWLQQAINPTVQPPK